LESDEKNKLTNKCCVKCGKEKQLIERMAYFHGEEPHQPNGPMLSLSVGVGVIICKLCYYALPEPRREEIQKLSHNLQVVKLLMETLHYKEGKA